MEACFWLLRPSTSEEKSSPRRGAPGEVTHSPPAPPTHAPRGYERQAGLGPRAQRDAELGPRGNHLRRGVGLPQTPEKN
jgi:hypothetical protein